MGGGGGLMEGDRGMGRFTVAFGGGDWCTGVLGIVGVGGWY